MGPYENEDLWNGTYLLENTDDPDTGFVTGSSSTTGTASSGKQGGNAQAWFGLGLDAFNSVGGFILSILGKNNNNSADQKYYLQQQQNNNRTLLIVGAVFVVVLILVIVLASKK